MGSSSGYNVFLVGGLYASFLAFGAFQERIYKGGHQGGDEFVFFNFLVFVLCVSHVVMATSMLVGRWGVGGLLRHLRALQRDAVEQLFLASLTQTISLLSTNYALKHVAYPTQVLVKSIKMVPVTVGGFVFFGKRYPWYDYVAVVAVSGALVLFNLAKGSAKTTQQTAGGLFFLFVALFSDSLTGPREDKLLARYPSLDPLVLMLVTNAFSVATAGVCALLIEGFAPPVVFCLKHPAVVQHILGFCVASSLGNFFIFSCLTSFGALHLTLITTTRKFFSVLLSVVLFGHHINTTQWMCVASIFASLSLQGYYAKARKRHSSHTAAFAAVAPTAINEMAAGGSSSSSKEA